MACVSMEEQSESITVSHNEHTHQLQEDTWAKSATNLLEEWTDIHRIADTHQDADLLQEDAIDTIPMKIEIDTEITVEETDMKKETDTEITAETTEAITTKATLLSM